MLEKIGILNYATKSQGIGGTIKTEPEDFVVEEVWDKEVIEAKNFRGKTIEKGEIEGDGDYIWFTLEKKDWDFFKIIRYLSNYCGVSKKRFTYSGTKDKFAVTSQRLCGWKIYPEKLYGFGAKDIYIYDAFRTTEKMELGDHSSNKFTIKIRDVDSTDIGDFLKDAEKGIPNFYGVQRFGSRFNSHLVGKQILKENFEEAAKIYLTQIGERETDNYREARLWLSENWGEFKTALDKFPVGLRPERTILSHLSTKPNDYANAIRKLPKGLFKIFVHAYQSYLFNLVLSERVKLGLDKSLEGDDKPLTCPVFGYDCKLLKGEAGEIEKNILKKEGLSQGDFRIKSMPEASGKGIRREAILSFKNFEVILSGRDLVAEFEIPSGSYATVLLEELMKVGAQKKKKDL
ncbi:tRNA pseudouridine(13) synthase TruD [Candidatus Undinarchaeota archaeon]